MKAGHLGYRHSVLQWETIAQMMSSAINSFPICHNQDDRYIDDATGLITPNSFIMGRNNARAIEGMPYIEHDPKTALKQLSETCKGIYNLLANYAHRFIPGKRILSTQELQKGDVVLFTMKESLRSRNICYKYGKITDTNIDGRQNKVAIRYRNFTETVAREVERNIKDVVLIVGINEVDFNSQEHFLAAHIQGRYLMYSTASI